MTALPAGPAPRTQPRMQPHDHAGLEPHERMAAAFWHQVVLDLHVGRRDAWDWLAGDEYEAVAADWMPHCSPADWRDRLLSAFWRDL